MTAQDVIARALALSEAATSGPWTQRKTVWVVSGREIVADIISAQREDDAEFIAAARTLLPALAKALGDVLDGRANHAESCGCGSCSHYKRNVKAVTAALSEVTR